MGWLADLLTANDIPMFFRYFGGCCFCCSNGRGASTAPLGGAFTTEPARDPRAVHLHLLVRGLQVSRLIFEAVIWSFISNTLNYIYVKDRRNRRHPHTRSSSSVASCCLLPVLSLVVSPRTSNLESRINRPTDRPTAARSCSCARDRWRRLWCATSSATSGGSPTSGSSPRTCRRRRRHDRRPEWRARRHHPPPHHRAGTRGGEQQGPKVQEQQQRQPHRK